MTAGQKIFDLLDEVKFKSATIELFQSFSQESRPKNWIANACPEHLTALPDGSGYLQHNPSTGFKEEHSHVKLGAPQPGLPTQRIAGASREYLEKVGYVGLYKIEP